MALPQRSLRRLFLVATLGFACQPGRAATEQELGEDIALLTDRDWEADGERCQQQVVQLSVPALEEGQTVTVSDLSVSFTAEWAGFCGPVPDDDNLSIAVERV